MVSRLRDPALLPVTRLNRNPPLGLSHPFADQVRAAHTKECALCLCCNCLRKERFSRPWRTVQEDTTPWRPLASEKVRELDGQNHSFLESLFGALQSRHIIPRHVGRFGQYSTCDAHTKEWKWSASMDTLAHSAKPGDVVEMGA